jgi:hypothetical protein
MGKSRLAATIPGRTWYIRSIPHPKGIPMKKKVLYFLLALTAVSYSNGLVIVERDIRDVLPLTDGVTVYHVARNWFLAEAPASWGTTVAESAEGLCIAHLADVNAQVPGRLVFSRDGVAVFEPLSPLPLTAHRGIRQITPLRPFNETAFFQPLQMPYGGSRDMISEIIEQPHQYPGYQKPGKDLYQGDPGGGDGQRPEILHGPIAVLPGEHAVSQDKQGRGEREHATVEHVMGQAGSTVQSEVVDKVHGGDEKQERKHRPGLFQCVPCLHLKQSGGFHRRPFLSP